jgi:hypothetical protein
MPSSSRAPSSREGRTRGAACAAERKCRHGSLPAAIGRVPENICSSGVFLRLGRFSDAGPPLTIAVRRDKAGIRKPPKKETASRKGVAAAATYGDLRVAGVGCRAVGMAIEDDLDGWRVTRERLALVAIRFGAAAVFARSARSIIGRAPPARRQKRTELRRGG